MGRPEGGPFFSVAAMTHEILDGFARNPKIAEQMIIKRAQFVHGNALQAP